MVSAIIAVFVVADFITVQLMLGNMLRFERGWAAARIAVLMALEFTIWALLAEFGTPARSVGVLMGEILVIIGAVICSYIKTWNTAKVMQEQQRPVPANYKTLITVSGIILGISFVFDIVGILQIIAYVIYAWLLLALRQAGAPLIINRIFFSIVGQIVTGLLFSILVGLILVGAINANNAQDANNSIIAAVFFNDLYFLASKLFIITSMGYTVWDICCAPPKEILNVQVDGTNFYALGDEPLVPASNDGGTGGRATVAGETNRSSDLPTVAPAREVRDSSSVRP